MAPARFVAMPMPTEPLAASAAAVAKLAPSSELVEVFVVAVLVVWGEVNCPSLVEKSVVTKRTGAAQTPADPVAQARAMVATPMKTDLRLP